MVFTQKATLQALMYCAAAFAAKPVNFELASVQKVLEGCGLMPEFLRPPRTLPTQSDPGGFAAHVLAPTDRDLLLCKEVMMFEMLLRRNFWQVTCSSSFRSQGKSKHSVTLKQSSEERYCLEEKEIKSRETPILIIYPSQCTPFCNLWYH